MEASKEKSNAMPAKPVTLAMDELKSAVVNAINGSGLAAVFVEMAVKDVFVEVIRQAIIQRAAEADAYREAVKVFEEEGDGRKD